jgi:hypothetical protein
MMPMNTSPPAIPNTPEIMAVQKAAAMMMTKGFMELFCHPG